MEEICSTCRYYLGEGSFCGGMEDCWEPKESGIHAARGDIDRTFTAFTDKLKGERTLERSCVTCNKDVSSDCAECGDAYYLWEPIPSLTAFTDKLKGERTMKKICVACENILTGCISKSGFCVYPDRFVVRHTVAEQEETTLTDTQKKISEICDEVKNILLEKNRKYGDSAINPKRVFSKASPIEQINIRIDDKISRIMSAQDDDTEDAELDLIGYLILKRVAKKVLHDVQ